MKKTVPSNFSGMLDLQHIGEFKCDSFFNICNNVVSLIPLTDDCRKHAQVLSYNDGSNEKINWIYGFSEDNCSVAFVQKSHLSTGFSSGIDLCTSKFYTPIVVKSTNQGVDLQTFDSIEFFGGIVDILLPSGIATKNDCENHTICFVQKDIYTKSYDVDINNENFKVTYTISFEDLSSDTGKIPDLRKNIHSILRFDFDMPQYLSKIETYYSYAMSLFQFCTGHLNIGFEIRLHKKKFYCERPVANSAPILVNHNDGFNDYANNIIDLTKVIRFQFLGDKFPVLIKMLCEEKTAPHLLFLPKKHSEVNGIIYTFVSDICVAFEKEHKLLDFPQEKSCQEEAKQLTERLLEAINSNSNRISEIVCNKARNILNSQLKNFSPSLSEKITVIYDEFEQHLKTITEQANHDAYGIIPFYSSEDFKTKIKKFVEMRNKSTHSGIVWNDSSEIYIHLKLLVYFCILKRAGYEYAESACMLRCLFGRFF
jgi:hypothetical protein